MEYRRDEHRVHLVVYHLVWCPKRRKAVLRDHVASECDRIIRSVCSENGWEAVRLAVKPDHVHLFVRADPSTPASDIARRCKGRTSHVLRRRHRHLLKLPSLWTRSFLCSTAGNVSQRTIDRYIQAQKGK